MRNVIWIIGVILSIVFLFTRTSNEFLGSTFLFYFLSGLSLIILGVFSYLYFSLFEKVSVKQLKNMSQNPSITWFGWFARNLSEWTTILLVFTPYVIIFLCLSKGLSFLFPFLSFLQTIAFFIAMFVCMFMVFLLISVFFHWLVSRKESYSA